MSDLTIIAVGVVQLLFGIFLGWLRWGRRREWGPWRDFQAERRAHRDAWILRRSAPEDREARRKWEDALERLRRSNDLSQSYLDLLRTMDPSPQLSKAIDEAERENYERWVAQKHASGMGLEGANEQRIALHKKVTASHQPDDEGNDE